MKARALRRMAFAFRESRALFAGLELGVFAALADGPEHAEALAAKLELDPRALAVLLDALTALGALRGGEHGHALAPDVRELLAPAGAGYLGNLWLHDLWHWSTWARLDRAVRTGEKQVVHAGDPHLGDPAVLGRFLPNYVAAMEQSACDGLDRIAEHVLALGVRRVLDLGSGSGGLAAALLVRSSSVRATLVDHAFALAQVPAELAANARVSLLEGDFERDTLPGEHDVIVLSRVLMGLPPLRARALVVKAAAALPPGGCLVLHEFDREARIGAVLGLDMLLNTGGETHAAAALERWLDDAGLIRESAQPLLAYTRLWIARKP